MALAAKVKLKRLSGDYAVSRLDASSGFPDWADGTGFVSISRSDDELSIVCLAERVPGDARSDGGWTCYKLVGPFAFDETGIVSSVIGPLSDSGLGIFVVSTFDGDHLLLKTEGTQQAEATLRAAGHTLI
jgi:hypothetical protein